MSALREYFYFIDGNGHLYHDGTRLDEPRFLAFFFKHLKENDTGLHAGYAYVSPCGREMNFVRVFDTPLVLYKLEDGHLYYGPGLAIDFEPEQLRYSEEGYLYHIAPIGKYGRLHSNLLLTLGEQMQDWGPYFSLKYDNQLHVIEPLEPDPDLQVLRPGVGNGCFGCGQAHGNGLRMSFLYDRKERNVRSWLVADEQLQGRENWMHGGFISLLMDEVMGKVLRGMGLSGPTANLNVDFRRPCRLHRNLELRGSFVKREGRKVTTKGALYEQGEAGLELLSEASGLFIVQE